MALLGGVCTGQDAAVMGREAVCFQGQNVMTDLTAAVTATAKIWFNLLPFIFTELWHQQTAHPHDRIHAVCHLPGTVKTGIQENTSPKCQTPLNVSICQLKSVMTTNCSQVETLVRTTSMQMSFPETVSDSLCRKSLVMVRAVAVQEFPPAVSQGGSIARYAVLLHHPLSFFYLSV